MEKVEIPCQSIRENNFSTLAWETLMDKQWEQWEYEREQRKKERLRMLKLGNHDHILFREDEVQCQL